MKMRGREFVAWCVSISLLVVIGALLFGILTDPIPRYSRMKAMDSVQRGEVFDIRCTAYSNRPTEDLSPPYTTRLVGFRVVSDCRTVAK